MGAHQIFRPGPTRDGYRRGEPLIPATSSWERHAHPTQLHSDQWLATRGWLLQECAQPFGGGQGEFQRLKHGWTIGVDAAHYWGTWYFLIFDQKTVFFIVFPSWLLDAIGLRVENVVPILGWKPSIFIHVWDHFWPYPGWITLDCPFGIAWILVLGDFIIRQQSCPHFSSSKSDLGGCGNPWLPCSPVVPHSGQSAACLSVGPKRLCERGGGGRTWKDTWRVLGRMNHKNGGLHVEN